ncbi:MAG: class I SAM-dependent methyltransferase, partial [Angustibacter sp.]
METAGRIAFDKLYGTGEKKGPSMPWNIGGPQPAIRSLCDSGGFQGHVLDLGCGLGDNALYLASAGLRVTGVDISDVAIEFGREKAERLQLDIDFQVADVFTLPNSGVKYDTILDSAFFHTLPEDDTAQYLTLLRGLSRPGTRLHLFTFAKELTPDFPGPR